MSLRALTGMKRSVSRSSSRSSEFTEICDIGISGLDLVLSTRAMVLASSKPAPGSPGLRRPCGVHRPPLRAIQAVRGRHRTVIFALPRWCPCRSPAPAPWSLAFALYRRPRSLLCSICFLLQINVFRKLLSRGDHVRVRAKHVVYRVCGRECSKQNQFQGWSARSNSGPTRTSAVVGRLLGVSV